MDMDGRPISFTVCEWQRVQSLFNSDILEDLKECHIILTAWNHRIPMVAVVCCEMVIATLIGAKLEMPPDLAYMKLDTMRRQCAIAVIRFVNYINEMGQPGGIGKPLEMKKAVAPYGVPPWLVDVRHESTHNELPILERLQTGVAFARKWLWDNFWTRPVHEAMKKAVVAARDPNEILIDGDGGVECRTIEIDTASIRRQKRVMDLMLEYVEWRGKNVTFEISKCGMMDRADILIRIENALLQEPYDFYKCLVSDGFLILSEEQLAEFKAFDAYGPIPSRVQKFWDPVITMSFENNSLQLFIVELMDRLRDESASKTSRAQLITWAKLYLEGAFSTNLLSVRDWSSILSSMVALPGIFTKIHMKNVMDRIPELEEKRRRQVHRIMDISMHDEDGHLMEDSMTVKTIDDLKKAIEKDVSKKNTDSSRGVWSLSTEKEWRSTPLGMVPSQHFDSFSLIIDDSMLSKWEIVPSGPLNWNAVFDEESTVRDPPSYPSESSPPMNGERTKRKEGGGTTFAPPVKVGKRKSREGDTEDSFVESMKKKKKKKKQSVVTLE